MDYRHWLLIFAILLIPIAIKRQDKVVPPISEKEVIEKIFGKKKEENKKDV